MARRLAACRSQNWQAATATVTQQPRVLLPGAGCDAFWRRWQASALSRIVTPPTAAAGATPVVREVVQASAAGSDVTVTTGAGTQVDDVLYCIHGCDFGTVAGMTTPTGTAGTWAEETSADLGTNSIHMKVWSRTVTSGGAQTVTVPHQGLGEENFQFCYVVTGVGVVNDGAAGATSGSGTAATAPSVSPTGSDDLLLCAWLSANNVVNFTAPGGMTNLLEEETAGAVTLATARQVLSASGATGTRVATANITCSGFTGVSIAVKGAATGPIVVTVGQAVETGTAQAVTSRVTGLLGQASETGTAQAVTSRVTAVVGQPVETGTAQPVTTPSGPIVVTVGQVSEADTTQPVTVRLTQLLGQPSETDAAQPVTVKVTEQAGQVSETASAQQVAVRLTRAIGQAGELATAQPVTAKLTRLLGQVSEVDTAQPVTATGPIFVTIGRATEADTAQAVTARVARLLGQATEIAAAQQVTAKITRLVGQAGELDSAHPVSVPGSLAGVPGTSSSSTGRVAGLAASTSRAASSTGGLSGAGSSSAGSTSAASSSSSTTTVRG